ncbi:MAG: hypothetical protein A2252_11255 [Elusimicrobia bacterium RIFOXYA2_FULL_39_19]|nr:MAG: hypothetical protein A2252_11255 [Elusimicrobia bacterium RIFOXYA2_FULL_39_19]
MKKKTIFYILLTVLCLKSYVYAGWPINITPEIEGQVLDEITGEPIENALVGIFWESHYLIGGPGGPGYITNKTVFLFTDKNGRFKFRKQYIFHLFTVFLGIRIRINHPLYYDSKIKSYAYDNFIEPNNWLIKDYQYGNYDIESVSIYNNKVIVNRKFIKLKDRYKINLSIDNSREYEHILAELSGLYSSGYDFNYFGLYKENMKDLGYLKYIVSEFRLIEGMFPKSEYNNKIDERIKYYEIEYLRK